MVDFYEKPAIDIFIYCIIILILVYIFVSLIFLKTLEKSKYIEYLIEYGLISP